MNWDVLHCDVPTSFFPFSLLPFHLFYLTQTKVKNVIPCYHQVRFQDINLADRSYTLNPFSNPPEEGLLQSISNFGILHPPLLLEKQDRTFIILSGRRRIEAFLKTNKTPKYQKDCHLTALIISLSEEKSENQLYLFTALLQHQLLGKSLTVIEQAVFLQKARLVANEQELLALLPMLGLKAKPHIPGDFISLLDLEPAVQLGLHRGIIAQRSGKKLSRFSLADQKHLAEVIDNYQLGGSKQQKLIERFFQLTQREQVSVEVLLDRWRDREKDKQLNGPQKTSSLLRWLDRECQPRLTQAEEDFRKFCCQLQLPAGVRVEHSLSFEEEKVALNMDFSKKEELAKIWPQLKALLKAGE
ncbi:ParB/Sulfiredoxin domain-containing protein [Candidatus Electrothrix laxa]